MAYEPRFDAMPNTPATTAPCALRCGGQPMDRITLIRMLQNRMYIGEAMYDGEWHGMVYPPIVDYELWKAVQEKLAERARRKGIPNAQRQKDEFPFLGKLYWHDGRAYTAHQSSARGKKCLFLLEKKFQPDRGWNFGEMVVGADPGSIPQKEHLLATTGFIRS